MSERILETLEPVRRRQLSLEVLRDRAIGLLAGSLLGVGLGVLRWQSAPGAWSTWAVALLVAGPVLGAFVGLVRGRSIRLAAGAVDRCYDLKDRAATAVDFIRRGQPTTLHVLQVADAQQHLAGIDVARVAPYRIPSVMPYALATTALALGLLLWPQPTRVHAQPAAPLEAVLAAALDAEESLEDLQEAAKKENDPKLKELVQKLNETIQEMKLPGVDTKEALAKLSEMQAAVAAQQAQFNVGLVDAQMQALGEAMASTQALEGAGQALQQGKYDKAAEQLERAEPKFDRKEAKTLKEKLAQSAKAMEEAGLADLSTATTELSEAMDDEEPPPARARSSATWPAPRAAARKSTTCSPPSAGTLANAKATARRTAQSSCGFERSQRNPAARGAWPSAATPTATAPSSTRRATANRSRARWVKGHPRPKPPTCRKAARRPREPIASNTRSIAA